jgi:hypothetical protein
VANPSLHRTFRERRGVVLGVDRIILGEVSELEPELEPELELDECELCELCEL